MVEEQQSTQGQEKENETVEKSNEDQVVVETENSEATDNESGNSEDVTIIYDDVAIEEYMASLDPKKPAIVIYNEQEGYKINMGEGQTYHLKKQDRILISNSRDINQYSTSISGTFTNLLERYMEIVPDYTQFDLPHKSIYKIWLVEEMNNAENMKEDEYYMLTCWLYPPTEI